MEKKQTKNKIKNKYTVWLQVTYKDEINEESEEEDRNNMLRQLEYSNGEIELETKCQYESVLQSTAYHKLKPNSHTSFGLCKGLSEQERSVNI